MHQCINNSTPPKDGDFLFYFWETLEKKAEKPIEGMMPFQKSDQPSDWAVALGEHLPGLLKEIDGD